MKAHAVTRVCPGLIAVLACWLGGASQLAAQRQLTLEYAPGPTNLTLRLTNDVALYHLLERGTNLPTFVPHSMKLGHGGPQWTFPYAEAPGAFFRSRWFSLYGPGDFDRDGMDDVWELDHPGVLDPLNPADAGHTNAASGLTWLEEYELHSGRKLPNDEAISREVSLYNHGVDLPGGRFEAISRETSLYNHGLDQPGGRFEAVSKEVSLYRGERPPHALYPDAISREISLYNHGVDQPGGRFEAVSREVSLYRGERAPALHQQEAISREVSLYNFGVDQPGGRYEAISREVSVYNGDLGTP